MTIPHRADAKPGGVDDEIQKMFAAAGLALEDEDWAFFERLRAAVVAANRRMNLTRLVEPRDFYLKHVLDSALPFVVVPELAKLKRRQLVADLGSGAGFPGLVLARLRPRWDVALVERTQKKAGFLEDTIEALGIGNAYVVPFDASEAQVLVGGCDLVVARAVGRIAPVTRTAEPLLGPRGILVHYKGGRPDPEEISEGKQMAGRLGLKQLDRIGYDLPPDARRSAVLSRSTGRRRGAVRRRTRAKRRSRGGTAP